MNATVDDLLEEFEFVESGHRPILAALDDVMTAAPATEVPTIEAALSRLELEEAEAHALAADTSWTGDLVVFVAATLTRIDPTMRQSFPTVNTWIEAAAAGLPGGGIIAGILLALAEGPLLAAIEAWLSARAKAILASRAPSQ